MNIKKPSRYPLTPSWSSCKSNVSTLAQDIRNYSRLLAARGQLCAEKATSRQLLSILLYRSKHIVRRLLAIWDNWIWHLPICLSICILWRWRKHLNVLVMLLLLFRFLPISLASAQREGLRDPFGTTSAPTFHVNLTTGRGSQRGTRQRQTPPNFQEVSSKKMMDSGELCAARI